MMKNDILNRLIDKGYESYIVGGYLRDGILSRESFDVDIATSARPEEVKALFKDYKIIDIGQKFGTIKIIDYPLEYEITTMRCESTYNDKRHPEKIKFTKDIYKDLKRRDFTINAMATANGKIIDPYGGRDDLRNKIIRAVANPYDRIREDMLRALRAVRFACLLDFDIEENLLESIRENARSIEDISKERIQSEINKILLSDNPVRGIKLLDKCNLLSYIFPEVYLCKGFDQHSSYHSDDVYDHSLKVLGKTPPILEVRMAALYHDVGKIDTFFIDENGEGRFFGHQNVSEEKLINRLRQLKYSKKFILDSAILVKRHMDSNNTYTKKSVRKLLRNLGYDNVINLFHLQRADILSTKFTDDSNIDLAMRILDEILNDDVPKGLKEIKINGNDLKKLGYKEGKDLGLALEKIENLIYDEKLKNNKEDIINYIKTDLINVDW